MYKMYYVTTSGYDMVIYDDGYEVIFATDPDVALYVRDRAERGDEDAIAKLSGYLAVVDIISETTMTRDELNDILEGKIAETKVILAIECGADDTTTIIRRC